MDSMIQVLRIVLLALTIVRIAPALLRIALFAKVYSETSTHQLASKNIFNKIIF